MSLQGITVALAPTGIQYFVTSVLVPDIVKAIENVTLPPVNIPLGGIRLATTKTSWTSAFNANIALTAGELGIINPNPTSPFDDVLPFTPSFQSLTQGSDGEFTLSLVASNVQAAYTWTETYDKQQFGAGGVHDYGLQTNVYSYSIVFATLTVAVVFDFAFTNNQWQLTFKSSSVTTTGVTPNIPPQSIANLTDQGCMGAQISQATQNAVDTIDFGTLITGAIQPVFTSIPASGNLTPNIVFQFPVGPSGLTFPSNSGIAAGVTGVATYQGTAYPGANPPQLSLPAIPANNHLNYYASDYSFNSLMWAFFQAGDLVATVLPGDIPTPGDLNTSSYQNGPLQALSNQYPNTPMSASITALSAPTVQFAQIYELTATNMTSLTSQLSSTQLTALGALKGVVYLDEPTFFAAVVNALGQATADQYKSAIEQAANAVGAVVTHNIKVVLNVVSQGVTTPVITFNVNETDVLQQFGLGVSASGTAQTLKFVFQLMSSLTTATFVSSTISSITSGNFTDLWNFVLQPMYANQLTAMGQAGVPLPRINGFDFLFNNATITLQPGYASVLTNVQYTGSAQATPVATETVKTASGGD